jgi:hypothetical protein
MDAPRFQAERRFAWFERRYRCLVVHRERLVACFVAFLALAIHIWIQKLVVGYIHGTRGQLVEIVVPQ